jgi:hypothetical protein
LTLGLRSKLILVSLTFAVCFCAAGYSIFRGKLEAELGRRARDEAMLRAALGAQSVQQRAPWGSAPAAWSALAAHAASRTASRVTLIDRGGRLLADSSGATHDLHELVGGPA